MTFEEIEDLMSEDPDDRAIRQAHGFGPGDDYEDRSLVCRNGCGETYYDVAVGKIRECRAASTVSSKRRWRLNPVTFQVEPEDGEPAGTFTGQEWRAQQWPKCPVCGGQGEPQRVDVHTHGDQFPVFLAGAWECPNDCDPRGTLAERNGRCPNCRSTEKPVRGARPMLFSTVEPVDFMGDKVTVRVSQEICDHDWREGQFAGTREISTP